MSTQIQKAVQETDSVFLLFLPFSLSFFGLPYAFMVNFPVEILNWFQLWTWFLSFQQKISHEREWDTKAEERERERARAKEPGNSDTSRSSVCVFRAVWLASTDLTVYMAGMLIERSQGVHPVVILVSEHQNLPRKIQTAQTDRNISTQLLDTHSALL